VNERQQAAVNVVIGTVVAGGLVVEPGPRQVLATLQSSPVLLAVGLFGIALVTLAERADRRFDRRGASALLTVILAVPMLAAGHAVAGVAGVRTVGALVMLGVVGVSAVRLLQTQSGAPPTADAGE
jgi:hypothetical protein